jgi:selenium-binding protein 1
MKRREFLAAAAAGAVVPLLANRATAGDDHADHNHGHGEECIYASPQEAMKSPRETLAFVSCPYVGTGVDKPDYLAVVDMDPESKSYGSVVSRLSMPNVGDELHHYGWNACSSCHGDPTRERRYLVLPGLGSSRIHIIDVADPRDPKLHKVIEPEVVKSKTNLSAPHTVHCLPDGHIMISMLGDAKGDAPGGFMLLDDKFDVVGRWGKSDSGMEFNYDYWYQLRHNVMVSSQWAAPNTVRRGFHVEEVQAGKYGRKLHFWNWEKREIAQTVDLGEEGLIPLEVRWQHDPDSTQGFVGAALSSAIWHWDRVDGSWTAKKIIQVDPVEKEGWPFPVPGLITDLVLSLDDRFLYFSNWLHGDIRQYDVSDPSRPKLTGQVWLGGLLGKRSAAKDKTPTGGPQMMQLSLDGRRLYVTSSLYSNWDNQFYPDMAKRGSFLLKLDCDTEKGGMSLDERFYTDFGAEPDGPVRAHEIRFPGGDCTSDIWV